MHSKCMAVFRLKTVVLNDNHQCADGCLLEGEQLFLLFGIGCDKMKTNKRSILINRRETYKLRRIRQN